MPDLVKENTSEARQELYIRSRTSFRLPVIALGMSLGLFFAVTFILCVSFDLLFPDQAMYKTWLGLLPGFTWLSWPSFFLGLGESFAYGWYVALIFGPLFNFFAALGSGNHS
ncbi:DUF5676 family membrane protein [Sneathiella sp.]|jgi:hypothetical protein|uniref:DUF5676 family membrane protein n=1 Tax=uncultured Sneathiella sp. TaxID=879315 RepID=UPI0025D573BB|nr:DUF5676 family membrane protein [Sneathiella sp.]|tara:strand:- start:14745 stop:15080 length:336 start_codon:yes stop_codon:yes gene_type:complete